MQANHADTNNSRDPGPTQAGNWSPQQQTARMLALCEAQMEAATQDSDAAVDSLVSAFTGLLAVVSELNKLSRPDVDNSTGNADTALQQINAQCAALSAKADAAVVAFQFYDKLSQRLGHVRYSLSTMALFICDRSNSQRPEHWEKLLHTLGRLYRTAEERTIFDSIAGSLYLTSSSHEEPLAKAMSDAGSIELF